VKRQNIEVVLGFLDAIRRRDRDAAAEFLDPEIVWRAVITGLSCRTPGAVIDTFLGPRVRESEVDGLELIGADRGAVFAVHRPGVWDLAGVEIKGAMYHAARIDDGRITAIDDYAERAVALAAVGFAED
jgi:ketosteroid isomerase-like protein